MDDKDLRKWCLEQAFKTRDQSNIACMAVTNVAEEYYRWVIHGESQANCLSGAINLREVKPQDSGY